MIIRPATEADAAAIWTAAGPVIRAGETYTLDREMSREDTLAYWFGADKEVFVAEDDGAILGTYYLRANQTGGGAHVCNAGYVTGAAATGRGFEIVGRLPGAFDHPAECFVDALVMFRAL